MANNVLKINEHMRERKKNLNAELELNARILRKKGRNEMNKKKCKRNSFISLCTTTKLTFHSAGSIFSLTTSFCLLFSSSFFLLLIHAISLVRFQFNSHIQMKYFRFFHLNENVFFSLFLFVLSLV